MTSASKNEKNERMKLRYNLIVPSGEVVVVYRIFFVTRTFSCSGQCQTNVTVDDDVGALIFL